MLQLAWVVGLCFLVATTRLWRIPRTLHIAGWLLVLLVVALVRAWGPAAGPSPWDRQIGWLTPAERQGVAAIIDVFATGLVVGVVAMMELCLFLVGSWVGGLLRPKQAPVPAARVSLLRRMAVVALHAPLAAVLFGVASALAAGGLRVWSNGDALGPTSSAMPAVLAGGVLWLVALVHVDRLFAIGQGARTTRIALAVIGVAAAAVLVSARPSIAGGALVIAWCIAQLAALWWARSEQV